MRYFSQIVAILFFSCIVFASESFFKGQKVKIIAGDWRGYKGFIGGVSPKQKGDTCSIYYVHLENEDVHIIKETDLKALN